MAKKGEKLSEEHKKKIKENNSHYWKGKKRIGTKFSEEAKKNISDAQKKRYQEGQKHPRLGKTLSEESRKKIREKLKGKVLTEEQRLKRKKTSLKAEKHPRWKGGVSSEASKIRNSIEIRLWKESVFARDNYTCQKTGVRGVKTLEAHHIKNFADFPELRTSIENGITLCKEAHIAFHKKYGRKNNSEEQLNEFLNSY